MASLYLGETLARTGHASDAFPFREEALETFTATGNFRQYVWAALAEAHASTARLDEARGFAERTLAWARERALRGWEPIVDHLLGLAATRSDPPRLAIAERHFQRAIEVAREYRRRPLVARCHLGLGELYRKVGQRGQAREHLDAAAALFTDMGMRFWLAQAEAEKCQLDPV